MSTIRSDVADTETTPASEFDATAAFLTSLGDDEDEGNEDASRKPSDNGTDDEDERAPEGGDEGTEDSDESPENDGDDEDAGENDEGKDEDKTFAEGDNLFVKVPVGDEVHEVSVKSLTRLFGQEAALTKKSQEVATLRTQAEAKAEQHATALQVLLNRAQEKAKPYRQIDWMAVSKDANISQEEASLLRAEAQKAFEEEAFLGENLQGFMTEVQKQQETARVESAKTCIQTLTTAGTEDKPNPLHIEGWSTKVYDDIRAFGVKMGMPAETVNTLTDPAAIKMIHMAMQFAKGASKVATIKTNKVNKTPKKIVKTSSAPVARDQVPVAAKRQAMKTLRANPNKSGAAADAFYASMGGDDD